MSMPTWLSDVVKVGEGVLSVAAPELAPVVGIVNSLLPSDKQLPQSATGNQVAAAYQGLNPDQQMQIREKMLDTQAQEFTTQGNAIKAMFAEAANNPGDLHNKIAYQSFQIVAFSSLVFISMYAYAVGMDKDDMIKEITNGWQYILSAEGLFVYVIKAWFGAIQMQHAQHVAAATGQPLPMLSKGLATIIKAFRGQ